MAKAVHHFYLPEDRVPLPPPDAKVSTTACDYCIVGCGYHAYTWDVNKQGGTAPSDNIFGVDLAKQLEAETPAWYSPSMYNIVKQDGRDVHIVIKPDKDCVVNSGSGLGGVTSPVAALRGMANASNSNTASNSSADRDEMIRGMAYSGGLPGDRARDVSIAPKTRRVGDNPPLSGVRQ